MARGFRTAALLALATLPGRPAPAAERRWDWLELIDPYAPGVHLRHSLDHGRGPLISKTTLMQQVVVSDEGIAMGLMLPWVLAQKDPATEHETPRLGGDPYPAVDLSARLWKPSWGFLGATATIGIPYDGARGGLFTSYTFFGVLSGRWSRGPWGVDAYVWGGSLVTPPLELQVGGGSAATLTFLPTPALSVGTTAFRILSERWIAGLSLNWWWVGAFEFELSGTTGLAAEPSQAGNVGPTFGFRSGERSFFQATALTALGARNDYSTTLSLSLAWTIVF